MNVGCGANDPLDLLLLSSLLCTATARRQPSCQRFSGAQKLDKISETPVFSRLSDLVPYYNVIVDAAHNTSCFHIKTPFFCCGYVCLAKDSMHNIPRMILRPALGMAGNYRTAAHTSMA